MVLIQSVKTLMNQKEMSDKQIEGAIAAIQDILDVSEGNLKLPDNITLSIFDSLLGVLTRDKDFLVDKAVTCLTALAKNQPIKAREQFIFYVKWVVSFVKARGSLSH